VKLECGNFYNTRRVCAASTMVWNLYHDTCDIKSNLEDRCCSGVIFFRYDSTAMQIQIERRSISISCTMQCTWDRAALQQILDEYLNIQFYTWASIKEFNMGEYKFVYPNSYLLLNFLSRITTPPHSFNPILQSNEHRPWFSQWLSWERWLNSMRMSSPPRIQLILISLFVAALFDS
jgi:hypothetical protein